jgi:PBSX family phage terminase large subunit
MISAKQNKIRAFPYSNYDAIICDGAVRSGKTSIMMVTFVKWAMDNFNWCKFGICGKTVDSATKNIIDPFMTLSWAKERYSMRWRRAEKLLEVRRGNVVNVFEVFGGKDESSYMLVQGRTFAGVLLDEVTLMPESFVNQALARCSVEGARMWFSCNPANPNHWFYKNWIERRKERNALYLHFTMADNPSLSKKTLERYQSMYSGVFYQRYVEGKWVLAEGLVYPMFDASKHVLEALPETGGDCYASCDYGIQNATVFLLWRKEAATGRWIAIDEYYYSGREESKQITVSELVDGFEAMLSSHEECKPKRTIIDPSAAALIVELRKRGHHTQNAVNDVGPGIADVCTMLYKRGIAFSSRCVNTLKEFGLYSWDKKAADNGEDAPIKQNDHCMDAIRYFVKTMNLVKKFGKPEYIPLHKR